jgi:hypothetical protein|uniref:BSD domain-containing protein n=1 Tax=Phaeodactylum tricornutum TaxID=2850 RepID=A0A8J9TDM0_PHATR
MRASTGLSESAQSALIMASSTEGKNEDLQSSEATYPTETGSISEEENSGWFGGIGADFRTIACTLKETAGGVASFVHRSAVAVATEIAELEKDGEGNDLYEHHGDRVLPLPWEIISDTSSTEEDLELKEAIFTLSISEGTFRHPFSTKDLEEVGREVKFVLDEPRIHLIRRLLEFDDNLATMHARLSGRSDVREIIFWRNYFHHCEETRGTHLAQYGDLLSVQSQNSFVGADNDSQQGDDSSYYCVPTPPRSMNSTGFRSVDSMVFIDDTDT